MKNIQQNRNCHTNNHPRKAACWEMKTGHKGAVIDCDWEFKY